MYVTMYMAAGGIKGLIYLEARARDPVGFSDVILGIDWIDHKPTQLFITEFLSQLKAARTAILQSRL